jgi:phosphate transport system protein
MGRAIKEAILREHYLQQLRDLEHELQQLGLMVDTTIKRALWALRQNAVGEANAIIRHDDEIDGATDALTHYAHRIIATQGPVAGDLRLINAYIQCAGELERIADYAEGLATIVLRLGDQSAQTLDPLIEEMAREAREMFGTALAALKQRDPEPVYELQQRDDGVDHAYEQLFTQVTQKMQTDPAYVLIGTYTLWIGHLIERIADRATNIGEYVNYIVHGDREPSPN